MTPVQVATVSDEALLLLFMENYWRVWEYKAGTLLNGADEGEQPVPNYMKPGKQKDAWSDQGLICFNKLIEEVWADCKSKHGKGFEKVFMEETMVEGMKRRNKRQKVATESAVKVVNELESDSGTSSDDDYE